MLQMWDFQTSSYAFPLAKRTTMSILVGLLHPLNHSGDRDPSTSHLFCTPTGFVSATFQRIGMSKINYEELDLDSCWIEDEGLVHLAGHQQLNFLELFDDNWKQWATIFICLTGLELDLLGARIMDFGTYYVKCFKNLRLLERCGGELTDDGVKNIKELSSLTCLNLSQNCDLTDTTLELISGLTGLISLNVSNSSITNAGLHHLKTLKNMRSLSLESCKETEMTLGNFNQPTSPIWHAFGPNNWGHI